MRDSSRPAGMTETEYIFRCKAYDFLTGQTRGADADFLGRELAITAFAGHYGPAGLVLTVNGSPARLLLVVAGHTKDAAIYTLDSWGKARVIRGGFGVRVNKAKAALGLATMALLEERGYYQGGRLQAPAEG